MHHARYLLRRHPSSRSVLRVRRTPAIVSRFNVLDKIRRSLRCTRRVIYDGFKFCEQKDPLATKLNTYACRIHATFRPNVLLLRRTRLVSIFHRDCANKSQYRNRARCSEFPRRPKTNEKLNIVLSFRRRALVQDLISKSI